MVYTRKPFWFWGGNIRSNKDKPIKCFVFHAFFEFPTEFGEKAICGLPLRKSMYMYWAHKKFDRTFDVMCKKCLKKLDKMKAMGEIVLDESV